LLPPHELGHDLVDLRVHQRLAARDGHHRRAALLDGGDGLLDGHAPLQHVRGMLDLAAARAGEVAGEQRLEFEEQRELLPAAQLVPEDVGSDPDALAERHAHGSRASFGRAEYALSNVLAAGRLTPGLTPRLMPYLPRSGPGR